MSIQQAQKYLDPKTVATLGNHRLLARLIVQGFLMGLHRGPRHAFSLEYSKHRDYYPGDPLKLIDWKLYARTDRFFVKQFQEETNLQAWILMDVSKSMAYRGSRTQLSKLQYSSYLAAALSYLLIGQKDKTGMIFFDQKLRKIVPPSAAGKQLNILLRELQNVEGGEQSDFKQAARLAASRIRKRSLVILFSDLLDRPENIEFTLKHFLHDANELIVFHVLSFEELGFPFKKFGFFEDIETKRRVLLQPELIKDEYVEQMKNYLESIRRICMRLKVGYQMLETTTPFDRALTAFLKARSRMH